MRLAHEAERRDSAEESLREHATFLSNVLEMQSSVASAGPNLPHILHLVAEQAQRITDADGVVIELVEGDEMVYREATGIAAGSLGFRLIRTTSPSGVGAQPDELLRCDDTETDPRVDRAACRRIGARSIINVPLQTDLGTMGLLKVLSSRVHAFDDNDADTLRLVAREIAGAVRTAAEFDAKQVLLVERSEVAEELSLANAELESFAYSVSHDLRAPLRSLDGFSQLLLERNAAQLDERGKRYLGHVRAAAQEMGQLIDAVLALTRVTRGELREDRVELSELARSILADLARTDSERNVSVRITDGVVTEADVRLLRIVLQNLLGNAWKFTSKQPEAQIEFGMEERDGTANCFVRDNGAGFDMEYVDKLFGPFQRLHSASDFEGTGVGLATVQRIIRRHGGRVWAEGEVDRGATFHFTIPGLHKEASCKAAAS